MALLRTISTSLTDLKWKVREGAAFSGGLVDVAAQRSWSRKDVESVVHLLIHCCAGSEAAVFAGTRVAAEDTLASYSLGEDVRFHEERLTALIGSEASRAQRSAPDAIAFTAPARVPALAARVHASAFRADTHLTTAIETSLSSIADVLAEIEELDLDLIEDDLDAGARADEALPSSHSLHLVHGIVVTDAPLFLLGEHKPAPSLRLHRSQVVGAEQSWIDLVHEESLPAYAKALNRHYDSTLRKRRFRSAG